MNATETSEATRSVASEPSEAPVRSSDLLHRCRELEKRVEDLTKLCHRAADVMDAALTCPDDAGYRADAHDAVEELQAV